MQHSRALTQKSASNLALAFILLPREKRDAMSALYAFCRAVDDVADEDSVPTALRRQQLVEWREDILVACGEKVPTFILNQEFQPIIHQFKLPSSLFDELIQGCEMDLDTLRYPDYQQLETYCYRVASVVGLLSIEIFGYRNPACRDYAIYLGKALQLTNILRDVKNDAARGRIYLPQEDLVRFDVTELQLTNGLCTDNWRALMQHEVNRARSLMLSGAPLGKVLPGRIGLEIRTIVAGGLRILQKIESVDYNVFRHRPKLGPLDWPQLFAQALFR